MLLLCGGSSPKVGEELAPPATLSNSPETEIAAANWSPARFGIIDPCPPSPSIVPGPPRNGQSTLRFQSSRFTGPSRFTLKFTYCCAPNESGLPGISATRRSRSAALHLPSTFVSPYDAVNPESKQSVLPGSSPFPSELANAAVPGTTWILPCTKSTMRSKSAMVTSQFKSLSRESGACIANSTLVARVLPQRSGRHRASTRSRSPATSTGGIFLSIT